eukprot:9092121-Alexandrium_andersonii.AAC.1
MLWDSQAAESEAKQGEFEGAENPINMKVCERECALAEGTLQNEFEGGNGEKIEAELKQLGGVASTNM